jgi:hypothetical protein
MPSPAASVEARATMRFTAAHPLAGGATARAAGTANAVKDRPATAAAAYMAARRLGRRISGWVADSFAGIHLVMETTFRLTSTWHLPSA